MLERPLPRVPLASGAVETARVAVICHAHPSISKGGAEVAAYALYQGLCGIGIYAIFIALCAEDQKDRLSLGSAREYVITHRPETYEHFYQLGSAGTSARLNAILAAEKVTVVNFHHFFSLGFGAMRGVRAVGNLRKVMTFHEFLAICHHHGQMVTKPAQVLCEAASPAACVTCYPEFSRQQFAIRRNLALAAFTEFDSYVSPSKFLAERYVAWGLPPERMHIIENGLPVAVARPQAAMPVSEKPHWTFGFFGQINPFKGVELLLRAAELLRRDKEWKDRISLRIHGNLVGQGDDFVTRFSRAVRDNPILSWSGPYDNASVGRLMSACDYIVVPSRWWENSPVVIQEAFAAGRPVICSGIGGMAEKVADGKSGFHFRVNDHADFVRVLKTAADTESYNRLLTGLPVPYDGQEMARRYMNLFVSHPVSVQRRVRGLSKG